MLSTIDRICQEFGIDRPTLLRWVRDGIIPCPRILDGFVRFAEGDIAEWIENGCPACEPAAGFDYMRLRILIEDVANSAARLDADPVCENEGPELAHRGRELRERMAIVGAKARQLDKDIRRRRQRECTKTS